jgi:hypothetical protein
MRTERVPGRERHRSSVRRRYRARAVRRRTARNGGDHADPGTRPIEVVPHGAVSFALGVAPPRTGTRYVVTELRLTLPGDPAPVRVLINLFVGTPPGTPIPVVVTAFVTGTNGP